MFFVIVLVARNPEAKSGAQLQRFSHPRVPLKFISLHPKWI